MINYSTCMRGNPTDKDAAKKAYANAQYSQVMTLDKFCYHIASHGCVYSRADIQAILILAVDCLREQLLNGQQIQIYVRGLSKQLSAFYFACMFLILYQHEKNVKSGKFFLILLYLQQIFAINFCYIFIKVKKQTNH